MAINRMDAYLIIHHFGRRPRGNRDSVLDAILRVWISTLYGDEALANSLSRSKTSTNIEKRQSVARKKADAEVFHDPNDGIRPARLLREYHRDPIRHYRTS